MKSTKVQTLAAFATIDYTTQCIVSMLHDVQTSSVKCGRFHSSVAEALATAYSKEISNEICREASKTLVMNSHSALRA